mmetsp:Transcript_5734/g.16144  ORF Transcript_5734/g.16144 Transcript_5734/m.16144 type:complete len:207 (-) Transcript_5734:370-990(-)
MDCQRILCPGFIAVVLDNEAVMSTEQIGAGNLVGISGRQHGEQRRGQLVVEPLQQFRYVLDGHIGGGRLGMTATGPTTVRGGMSLGNFDRLGTLVLGQKWSLAHLHAGRVPPCRPGYRPKVFGLLTDVVRIERTLDGVGIDALVGWQWPTKVFRGMTGNGCIGATQHVISGRCDVAQPKHLLGFSIVAQLEQDGAEFQPRPRGRWG